MRSFSIAVVIVFFAISTLSQIHSATPDLRRILAGAAAKRLEYINEFKNLLSQETKSFEIYDKKGDIKKRRSLVSTFIVYPLTRKEGSVEEFRNIISVDNKPVSNADKRAQEFFEDVAKAESSEKEIEKIEKEASRYDEEVTITGLTLYQAPAIADNLRPYFDFKLNGIETLDGKQVYVIAYTQIKDSPYVSIDGKRNAENGKLSLIYDLAVDDARAYKPRLSGKLWIDAATLQIRKETRNLTIKSDEMAAAVSSIDTTLEYQDSSFQVLTPKRLVFIQYNIDKKSQGPRKEVAVTFDYTNFTKPDVEVKSADIKN